MIFLNKLKENFSKNILAICLVVIFQRFGFYGMRSILLLYMMKNLNFSQNHACWIFGTFEFLAFLLTLVGGVVADKFLGIYKSVTIGLIFKIIAIFLFMIGNVELFYLGLVIFAVGYGFVFTNFITLVGKTCTKDGQNCDSGYTAYYTSINIGAFIATIVCGYIGVYVNWNVGFFICLIGFIGAVGILFKFRKLLEDPLEVSNIKTVVSIDKSIKFSVKDKNNMLILLLATVFIGVFTMAYEQQVTSLIILIDKYVDKNLFSFEVPISFIQAINPLSVIIFGPLIALMFGYLERKNKKISSISKLNIGLFITGLAFFAIALPVSLFDIGISNNKLDLIWVVLNYVILTIAGLLVYPVGYVLVNELAPKKYLATFMSLQSLIGAIAGYMSGWISGYMGNLISLKNYYFIFAIVCCVSTILFMVLYKIIQNIFNYKESNIDLEDYEKDEDVA